MRQYKEDTEQTHLMSWAKQTSAIYPELDLLFHIPNGGKRNITEARRFKAQGVKAGVPDLCLPVPRQGYNGLYIEMKKADGTKKDISDSQKEWLINLQKQGYRAVVCFGFDDARELIEDYLGVN